MFGLFKKKDPICGMKEEKGKGISKYGEWFCSQSCLNGYEKQMKEKRHQSHRSRGCC